MSAKKTLLAAAAASTLLAATAPAQTDPPTGPLTVDGLFEEQDKRFAFPKVVDWKFVDVKSHPLEDERNAAFTTWEFRARTFRYANIDVAFVLLNGARPTPRLQAIYDRYGKLDGQQKKDDSYHIVLEPVVHAYYPLTGSGRSDLIVYRRARGRTLSLRFTVDDDKFEQARPELLRLAQMIEIRELETWPARPDGYEIEHESGVDIAFAPTVSKARRKDAHKVVRDCVEDFTKEHGAPGYDRDAPVYLIVTNDEERRRELVANPEANTFDFDLGARRLVTPVVDARDPATVAGCREVLTRCLAWSVYPETSCMWLHWGLRALARMEGTCGKGLPAVPERSRDGMVHAGKVLHDVASLTSGVSWDDAAAILAFFELGPAKYRRPFEKLLGELRTGTRPDEAVQRLLDAVDSEQMRKEAYKVLGRKLKGV